jgi:TRAP-type C4-dicarboxylate transport system substrate-binding protein
VTTNLGLGTIGFPTIVNIDAWEKLPEQYKELMHRAVEEGYTALHTAVAASDEASFAAYKKKGITLLELGDAEITQFRAAAGQPVWDEWVSEHGQDGKEVLDLVMKAAAGATN